MYFGSENLAIINHYMKVLAMTLCVDWNLWFSEFYFILLVDICIILFPKIPEAYFIRDPHTFLLTQDFIKVAVLCLVLDVFLGLSGMHSQV